MKKKVRVQLKNVLTMRRPRKNNKFTPHTKWILLVTECVMTDTDTMDWETLLDVIEDVQTNMCLKCAEYRSLMSTNGKRSSYEVEVGRVKGRAYEAARKAFAEHVLIPSDNHPKHTLPTAFQRCLSDDFKFVQYVSAPAFQPSSDSEEDDQPLRPKPALYMDGVIHQVGYADYIAKHGLSHPEVGMMVITRAQTDDTIFMEKAGWYRKFWVGQFAEVQGPSLFFLLDGFFRPGRKIPLCAFAETFSC